MTDWRKLPDVCPIASALQWGDILTSRQAARLDRVNLAGLGLDLYPSTAVPGVVYILDLRDP
jgi:hypothetical protein